MINKNNREGIVLILVLWVLFFLSVVAVTLGFKNRISIRLRSLHNEELRMFYLAKEGVNRAILELSQDDPTFDGVTDTWSKDFALQKDDGLLSYKVTDEDRFININTVSKEVLANAKLLVAELTDQHLEIIEKTRPFNVKRELLDLLGEDYEDIFYSDTLGVETGIGDLITVFADGIVNINTAPKEVLMLLPDMAEFTAIAIMDRRTVTPFESNDSISEELSLLGLTAAQISSIIKFVKVDSAVFRIQAEAASSRKNIKKNIEVVVRRSEEKINIIYYQEK
ncbi:MAG: hypothetical protein GY853_11785 [PVC group bacterium]|nr:hypothetical protein [PVC group bacterium]